MKTPYEVLDIADNADDGRVRKAYLAMVRRYPPERFPAEFQRIHQAYELIKTEEDRLAYRLFHCECPTTADIAALVLRQATPPGRPSAEEFQQKFARDLQRFCLEFKL